MSKNENPTPNLAIIQALAAAMRASSDLRTQAAVAIKAGVSQSTVGRLLRGDCDPQSDTLRRVADALNINLAVLLDDHAALEFDRRVVQSILPSTPPGPPAPPAIPLLSSWTQVVKFLEGNGGLPRDEDRWLFCPKKCGVRVFALRVEAKSMEPVYQIGDIIFVDPDLDSTPGKDVVARIQNRGALTLKRLVAGDQYGFLVPLNPNALTKIIKVSGDVEIKGVVIGKWTDRST